MKTLVINDTHIGTRRQAGTTPASQAALREFIQDQFRNLIHYRMWDRIVVNGDLFDGFTVDTSDIIAAHTTLSNYLYNEGLLVLCMGNHDASAKGDKVSSFHLLAHFLESQFPEQVQVVDHNNGLTQVDNEDRVWVIPHMLNQALFDLEIEKAAAMKVGPAVSEETAGSYLLLHCNVDSPFAEHADHSLNLSQDQIDNLLCAGWTVVVGHEHQQRFVRGKRVIIPGNQIPTSIADCLHNPANKKQHVILDEQDGVLGWYLEDSLDLEPIFKDLDWRDASTTVADDRNLFIRISGSATADEAADMVSVVAKVRQASQAFVVSNAVKVDGVAQMESLAEMSLESMSKFDVLEALLEELDERERETVREILK